MDQPEKKKTNRTQTPGYWNGKNLVPNIKAPIWRTLTSTARHVTDSLVWQSGFASRVRHAHARSVLAVLTTQAVQSSRQFVATPRWLGHSPRWPHQASSRWMQLLLLDPPSTTEVASPT